MSEKLFGIIPPMTTPFDADGEIVSDAVIRAPAAVRGSTATWVCSTLSCPRAATLPMELPRDIWPGKGSWEIGPPPGEEPRQHHDHVPPRPPDQRTSLVRRAPERLLVLIRLR